MPGEPDVEVMLVTGEKLRVAGTVEEVQRAVDNADGGWAQLELTPVRRKALVRVEHVCAVSEAPRRLPAR